MAGRRTKLTPEVQAIIIETLQGGGYAVTACARANISQSKYYEWLKKGEEGRSPYREFREAVKKAEAEAEFKAVLLVLSVAFDPENPNWQAAMTYLERRYPERWGRRDRTKVDMEMTGGVRMEHDLSDKLTTPERLAGIAQLAASLGLLPAVEDAGGPASD